jgi:hypothetical protein
MGRQFATQFVGFRDPAPAEGSVEIPVGIGMRLEHMRPVNRVQLSPQPGQ